MKHKLLLLLSCLSLLVSCSNDNENEPLKDIPQSIQMKMNGEYKIFKDPIVNETVYNQGQSNEYSSLTIKTWKENEYPIERFHFSVTKWKNGTTKANYLGYTDIEGNRYNYYSYSNYNFKIEVLPNSEARTLKGTFSGTIYENSGPNELHFTKGIFNIQY